MNFKFGQYIPRVHTNKSPLKFLEKRERGRIQGLPKFFGYPLLFQEWEKVRISNLASTYEQKPIKIFGEKGAWAYPGTSQFFRIPPIISETGKATNFKFCMYIYRLNRNKSPLKISRKVATNVVRDSRKFSGHPYVGRIARSSFLVLGTT